MRKILVVSLTNFYGGGENFIATHLQNINDIDFFYNIASEQLFEQLLTKNKCLLSNTSLIKLSKQIKKIVKQNQIEVIILNGGRSLFLAPLLHKELPCVGIRHTLNSYVNGFLLYKSFYIFLLNLSYCFMHKVVHVSQKSKSEQFFAKRNSLVIYNGVDAKTPKENHFSDKTVFLFAGRMGIEKGVNILIDAFNEICKENNTVHLYLVGKGELDSSYPHNENIHFEGFSTNIEQYYKNADWYISMTSRENCSISVIDALSYGLPVITTDVGGNPELIENEKNGFIINRTKDAIISLFNSQIKNISEVKYKEYSLNAIKTYNEKFDLQKQKAKYKELLVNI